MSRRILLLAQVHKDICPKDLQMQGSQQRESAGGLEDPIFLWDPFPNSRPEGTIAGVRGRKATGGEKMRKATVEKSVARVVNKCSSECVKKKASAGSPNVC